MHLIEKTQPASLATFIPPHSSAQWTKKSGFVCIQLHSCRRDYHLSCHTLNKKSKETTPMLKLDLNCEMASLTASPSWTLCVTSISLWHLDQESTLVSLYNSIYMDSRILGLPRSTLILIVTKSSVTMEVERVLSSRRYQFVWALKLLLQTVLLAFVILFAKGKRLTLPCIRLIHSQVTRLSFSPFSGTITAYILFHSIQSLRSEGENQKSWAGRF